MACASRVESMSLTINNDSGFEMSATIEAKTKGIWVWCVPHPKLKGRCLALMDTEGLGDPMKVHTSSRAPAQNYVFVASG